MINPKELLELNQILQKACDRATSCIGCPLMRNFPHYGCIKEHQEDEDEAKLLITFVENKKKESENEQSN